MMFGSVGISELLIIFLVALLLFGGKEMPKIAKDLGKGWREFQKATKHARDEVQKILDDKEEQFKG